MRLDNTDFDRTIFPHLEKLKNFADIQIKFMDKLESTFLTRIREFAPKKTGTYSRSWGTKEKTPNKIIFWTSLPDLYVILEFGTRGPYEIAPNEKRVLRFQDSAGNVVFTMRVEHPGISARPHARTALDDTIRDAVSILYDIIKSEMPWMRRV